MHNMSDELLKPVSERQVSRKTYLDTAKLIGIFFVVYAHFKETGTSIPYFYSFHLPLFFIITGMTLHIRNDEPYGLFLERKIKDYLIPLFFMDLLTCLFVVIFACWEGKTGDITWAWFMKQFVSSVNQMRFYAMWFIPALFLSVNICFFIVRIPKGKIWLSCLLAAAQLTFAIVYNKFTPAVMAWNFDAALFGSVFVFIGWLFSHFAKFESFFVKSRICALSWALLFIGAGFGLAYININTFHCSLEMFSMRYEKYHLSLPSAVLSSFGFIFLAKAADNIVFSVWGKMTLVILVSQQEFTQRLYRDHIAKAFYLSLNDFSADSIERFGYAFFGTLLALVIGGAMYLLIRYSPLAFMINKPIPDFYKKIFKKNRKQQA